MTETDWLAIHFDLDEDQCRDFDKLMAMKLSEWPPALYRFCYERSLKVGFSGVMLADTVAEWLSLEKDRELGGHDDRTKNH